MSLRVILGAVMVLLCSMLNVGAFRGKIYIRENITDYETCLPVVVNRSDDTTFPATVWIRIATSKNNFTLQLSMNTMLISPRFLARHISDGGEKTTPGHVNCFYQGEVIEHPLWTAVVSTCNGLRGSFGNAETGALFYIEPLSTNSDSLNQIHALYFKNRTVSEKSKCGTPHALNSSVPFFKGIEDSVMKVKRQGTSSIPIVELLVINDQAQFQQFHGDLQATLMRAIEIINGVDNLYKPLGVRIALVEVTTWSGGNKINVLSDSSTTLDNFAAYEPRIASPHDVAMLLTGVKLSSNVIGIAFIGTMCDPQYAVGVVEDFSSAAAVSSTAAHELGHIFNMQHDSTACQCSQKTCVMSAILGNPPPTQWSSCSQKTLTASLKSILATCLNNQPATTVGTMAPVTTVPPTTQKSTPAPTTQKPSSPSAAPTTTSVKTTAPPVTVGTQKPNAGVCGNGILESNETCDCGPLTVCADPCCNATTCQLSKNTQCRTGACCSKCRFVSYGNVCRASVGECDVAEYCNGTSADCPVDQVVMDGTECARNSAYCYRGNCSTRDAQCKAFYGQESGDPLDVCYTAFNIYGNARGNCGSINGVYEPCSNGNVYCGSLQCKNRGSQFPAGFPAGSVSVDIHYSRQCKSFVQISNPSNLWTVKDGTKCGTNMVCIERQCKSLSNQTRCPTTNGKICAGNGVCSNSGICVCNVGFVGSDCSVTRRR